MLQKYAQVEEQKYQNEKRSKLYILAFPSNDFHQEPGSDLEIQEKVRKLLGGDVYDNPYFLLFQSSSLKENPIYQSLHESMPNRIVRHNFFKYVIGKDGVPVSFHSKKETLMDMEEEIQLILAE